MKLTQVKLRLLKLHIDKSTDETYLVTWVPTDDFKVRVGTALELKKLEGIWKVEEVYSTVDGSEIKRG